MSAPFLSPPGREVALHQLGRVLGQRTAVVAGARPVAVGDLRNDVAALLERFEHDADVELRAESALDADLDVVEIDEYRNLQSCVCQTLAFLSLSSRRVSAPRETGLRPVATHRDPADRLPRGKPCAGWAGGRPLNLTAAEDAAVGPAPDYLPERAGMPLAVYLARDVVGVDGVLIAEEELAAGHDGMAPGRQAAGLDLEAAVLAVSGRDWPRRARPTPFSLKR